MMNLEAIPDTVRFAAISVATVEGMFAENYLRAIRLGEISLAGKPDIMLFPEAFAAGYCGNDLIPYGEKIASSRYLHEFRRLSKEGQCMVVVGYLEKVPMGVKNVVAIFDRGELFGTHTKSSMWSDTAPHRNELALLLPGDGIEVFESRFGRFAVLICYENMLEEKWRDVAGRVDFVLSPYNCEGDPSHNNIKR